jgi:hypothetical protein
MKLRSVLIPVVAAVAAIGVFAIGASAQEGPPPPSAGSVLASGVSSTGGAIGPDGALYAGVAGTAEPADEELTLPPALAEAFGIETIWFGLHSKVVRIDPETGEVTDYAEGLPSTSDVFGGEPFTAPADVIFVGDRLYVLLTGGAPPEIDKPWPNGVYRYEGDGVWTLVVDLREFALENPVAFPDAAPDGNPFAIDLRDGAFIISDGNHNRILRATTEGEVSVVAAFDNIVPTGLAAGGSGPILNTWFSAEPHVASASFLISVPPLSGEATEVAGGYAQLIDVEFGPGGKTYVLQFGDQALDEAAPPPPGRLLVLEHGELLPIVTGLMLPTSVNFSGDTAYITSLTGDVVAVPNVSGLEPAREPAPRPTTAPAPVPTRPSGTITPPDTGNAAENAVPAPMLALVALVFGTMTLTLAAAKLRAR